MEQKVIEAIMDGQTNRAIAKWLDPPVSRSSVQRYSESVVRPTVRNAEKLKAVLPERLTRNGSNPGQVGPDEIQTGQLSKTEAGQLAKQAILAAPALHIRDNRIRLNQAVSDRMLTVINERAEEMSVCEGCRRPAEAHPWEEMRPGKDKEGNAIEIRTACDTYRHIPGGKTGLIIRKLKANGYEYVVDTALLAEIREHEKHVAIELGQWQETAATGSVSIQIVCPTQPGEQPRITFAAPDALEGSCEEIGIIQRPD